MEYLLGLVGLVVAGVFLTHRLVRRTIILEYERGLLFRRGRFQRLLEPGVYWHTTLSSMITKLDMRPQIVSISGQEILSADNISIKLSVAVEYAIADPHRAIQSSRDYQEALYMGVQLALRSIVSAVKIDDLLTNRQAVNEQLLALTADHAQARGLQIFMVQLKDITFPADLKRMFAQVVKAQKEGLAALEKARGESAALRHLANAAKMLDNNPSLLQLRALLAVSESAGNSVVVTVPSAPPIEAITARGPSGTAGGEAPSTTDE